MEPGTQRERGRDAHLDWMRTTGVVAILGAHAIVPYMEHAPDWYVLDQRRWFIFDGLGLLAEAVCIPLLLFVAGAVVPSSLARRGPGSFVRSRALRLLAPVPLGCATLVAFADWLRASRHLGPIGFADYWPTYWTWGLNLGHLWYLPYLFVISAAAALAARVRPRSFEAALAAAPRSPGWPTLALFAVGIGLAKGGLLFWTNDQTWYDFALLNVQPSRVPINLGFFLLGMVATLGKWHEAPARRSRAQAAAAIAVISSAGLVFVASLGRPPPMAVLKLLDGLLHATVALCVVVMMDEWLKLRAGTTRPSPRSPSQRERSHCSGEGDRVCLSGLRGGPGVGSAGADALPGRTPIGRSLQASSYAIYLLHYGPVLAYGFFLKDASWHPALKYGAVVAASLSTSWLAAEGLRRIPGVRRVLG